MTIHKLAGPMEEHLQQVQNSEEEKVKNARTKNGEELLKDITDEMAHNVANGITHRGEAVNKILKNAEGMSHDQAANALDKAIEKYKNFTAKRAKA